MNEQELRAALDGFIDDFKRWAEMNVELMAIIEDALRGSLDVEQRGDHD